MTAPPKYSGSLLGVLLISTLCFSLLLFLAPEPFQLAMKHREADRFHIQQQDVMQQYDKYQLLADLIDTTHKTPLDALDDYQPNLDQQADDPSDTGSVRKQQDMPTNAFKVVPADQDPDGLLVETNTGWIHGKIAQRPWSRVRQFLGVPYAQPPLGPLRWTPPQPHDQWETVRPAQKHASPCPQLLPLLTQSENCLHLDIYVPTQDRYRGARWPVLVWIHGGAYIGGSGMLLGVQNPNYMVHHKDVIIVTVHYRMGPLGFLVTPGLEGNYGLMDQQAALRWVRDNIAAFNGDPGRITAWGESAGAMSIGLHMTAPSSFGLFQRAILQSQILGVRYRSREEAEKIGQAFAKRVGCDVRDLECMRALPLSKVMFLRLPVPLHNSERFLSDLLLWTPIVDGNLIQGQPGDLAARGQIAPNITVLLGTNRDEAGLAQLVLDFIFGTLIGRQDPAIYGPVYKSLVRFVFRDYANEVLKLYPSKFWDTRHNTQEIVEIVTDYMGHCPQVEFARSLTNHGRSTFMYSFEFLPRFIPGWISRRCGKSNVCHALEIPYVFHSLEHWDVLPSFTEEEHTLSHTVMDYWVDFASGRSLPDTHQVNQITHEKGRTEMEHDLGTDQGRPRARVPWFAFDHAPPETSSKRPNEEDVDYWWMEFGDDARAELKHGRIIHEEQGHCRFWNALNHAF